ncbi:MAG: hypothetical protein ACOYOL_10075 [Chthoniobacterales bacterium]|jgi:hypothetical protein
MFKTVSAALLALLLQAGPLLACTGCREPGEDVEASTVMAGVGLSWSVLFMLAFVFALSGGLGAFMWKTVRAVDARNAGRE